MLLILISLLVSTLSSSLPKLSRYAPYDISNDLTQLAVEKSVRQGTAWYENELTWLAENYRSAPSGPKQQAMLDYFMQVFCTGSDFKGFIGITGDEQLIINRTRVAELYASFPVQGMTFNVNTYNHLVTSRRGRDRNSLLANVTMSLTLITDQPSYLVILGWYHNEWLIDSRGNLCISRFYETTTKFFQVNASKIGGIPWNLKL